jgi:hypothetical protein
LVIDLLFKTMPIYVLCPDNSVKKRLGPCAVRAPVLALAHTRFGWHRRERRIDVRYND